MKRQIKYIAAILLVTIILSGCSKTNDNDTSTDSNTNNEIDAEEYIENPNTQDSEYITLSKLIEIQNKQIDNTEYSFEYKKLQLGDNELSINITEESDAEKYKVIRYRFADILFNIIKSENVDLAIDFEHNTYEYEDKLDNSYEEQINYIASRGVYIPGNEFSGYTYVTEQEVTDTFEKLYKAIDDAKNNEETPVIQVDNTSSNIESINNESEDDYSDILKDREVEDKLSGQSYALFKTPETLTELKQNITNLLTLDLAKSHELTGNPLNLDLINPDQAFINYTGVEGVDSDNLVGVGKLQTIDWNVIEADDDNLVLTSKYIRDYADGNGLKYFVGIKNNSIVAYLETMPEMDMFGAVVPKGLDIDMIGLVYSKDELTNSTVPFYEPTGSELTIVLLSNISTATQAEMQYYTEG